MESVGYDAFWSYTHEDNDRSGGRVLALASALKDEFAISTGDELGLFIDRKSLAWGDAWRDRVNEAIGEVPFFIPIITPKFVKSEECRKEFITFSGLAKGRGLDKLLLPILFIPVTEISEDSDDELMALIARTQFVDWTKLRLLAPDDPHVLKATNELALRIRELQSDVGAVTLREETKTPAETDVDLEETIAAIAVRLMPWMESVDFDKVAGATWRATRDTRLARVDRLVESGAVRSAIFSTFVQLGRDLLPIAEDRLDKAKNYSRLTIELDPLVNAAIRLVSLHREESTVLDTLRDGVNEAYLNIEPFDKDRNGYGYAIPPNIVGSNKHLSEADRLLKASGAFVREGNSLVMAWREKLIELDGPPVLRLLGEH
jgi:hypothetical protein